MRKKLFCSLLCLLCLILFSAGAEMQDESAIKETLHLAGLEQLTQLSQWDDTAACFAEKDGRKTLCVLDKQNGSWQLVVMNPNALRQDWDYPSLLLDSDQAVFWAYQQNDMGFGFMCSRDQDGNWGNVGVTMTEPFSSDEVYVYTVDWTEENGGEIVFRIRHEDDNENLVLEEAPHYLPAPWLKNRIQLATFDVNHFPALGPMIDDYFGWPGEVFLQDAAVGLMPEGYAYIHGILQDNEMHFFMRKPSGEKVYVVCDYTFNPHEVNLIESSPLPEDSVLGIENFTKSLGWENDHMVSIQNLPQHPWCGLDQSWGEDGPIMFGMDCAFTDEYRIYVGNHPWANISDIDWSTVPKTLDEAISQMDAGNINICYAVVNNSKPTDRLHLREKPDKGSRSLGKYYNGTPVKVWEIKGNWAQVNIGDKMGWMMKKYLIMGEKGKALLCDTSAMPQLLMSGRELHLYAEPDGTLCEKVLYWQPTMKVIGIIGDDWYHVWFPQTNEFYFVRQSELWAGNG